MLSKYSAHLPELLATAQQRVRNNPTEVAARLGLFQILCIHENWTSAVQQLQALARFDETSHSFAQVYRSLIICEQQRTAVFKGQHPVMFYGTAPSWGDQWIKALQESSQGHWDAADALREQVFAEVEKNLTEREISGLVSIKGQEHMDHFDWLSDVDTRLGPVCELMLDGQYVWLPFTEIAQLRISAPHDLRDLVWLPVHVRLHHEQQEKRAFIPVRYPNTEHTASDAQLLARVTEWSEHGRTGIVGIGQKTWLIDQADQPLLELRELVCTVQEVRPE